MTTDDAALAADYRATLDTVLPLYADGRYAEALAVVRGSQGHRLHLADPAHLAACLRALEGDAPGAVAELQAALDAGAWWDRHVLEDDDDLAAARAVPGWDALVEASVARCEAAQGEPVPDAVVTRPAGDPRVVLVALHGAGSDGADTAPHWSVAVEHGALLVAPYSSRRSTATHRTWPDLMVGSHDVERAVAAAVAPGGVPVVLGGFSAGGRQAMLMTLTANPEAPQRFLVVCPALGRITLDPGTARRAGGRGVRGHIVLGAGDEAYGAVTAAVALLSESGVETSLDVVDGLGHDYPADFAERLPVALDALLAD